MIVYLILWLLGFTVCLIAAAMSERCDQATREIENVILDYLEQ